MPKNRQQDIRRQFGQPEIVRGTKGLRGGFILRTGEHTHRVVKANGHRIKINGWNSERVPSFLARLLTDRFQGD